MFVAKSLVRNIFYFGRLMPLKLAKKSASILIASFEIEIHVQTKVIEVHVEAAASTGFSFNFSTCLAVASGHRSPCSCKTPIFVFFISSFNRTKIKGGEKRRRRETRLRQKSIRQTMVTRATRGRAILFCEFCDWDLLTFSAGTSLTTFFYSEAGEHLKVAVAVMPRQLQCSIDTFH